MTVITFTNIIENFSSLKLENTEYNEEKVKFLIIPNEVTFKTDFKENCKLLVKQFQYRNYENKDCTIYDDHMKIIVTRNKFGNTHIKEANK